MIGKKTEVNKNGLSFWCILSLGHLQDDFDDRAMIMIV